MIKERETRTVEFEKLKKMTEILLKENDQIRDVYSKKSNDVGKLLQTLKI